MEQEPTLNVTKGPRAPIERSGSSIAATRDAIAASSAAESLPSALASRSGRRSQRPAKRYPAKHRALDDRTQPVGIVGLNEERGRRHILEGLTLWQGQGPTSHPGCSVGVRPSGGGSPARARPMRQLRAIKHATSGPCSARLPRRERTRAWPAGGQWHRAQIRGWAGPDFSICRVCQESRGHYCRVPGVPDQDRGTPLEPGNVLLLNTLHCCTSTVMSTTVHNLLETTLKELASGVSIIPALRRVYAIATSLKNQALAEWVSRELSGYPRSASYPNPYGSTAPSYRLADLTIRGIFVHKVGARPRTVNLPIDLNAVEKFHSLGVGTLSRYFIPDAIEILERPQVSGMCLVKVPDLKLLFASFRSTTVPDSICTSHKAFVARATFRSAAKGVRMEAIRRLMETGLAGDPLQHPSLNILVENSLNNDQSTKLSAPGGQIGNVIAHSTLEDSPVSVRGQQLIVAPRTRLFEGSEEKQFREDIKQILHLLVDRYEEIDNLTQKTLQNTLSAMRTLEIQGKSLAELEDMLSDIWTKQEVASMRLPAFIEDAIAVTKVLKEVGGKVASLTTGPT